MEWLWLTGVTRRILEYWFSPCTLVMGGRGVQKRNSSSSSTSMINDLFLDIVQELTSLCKRKAGPRRTLGWMTFS